MVPDHRDDLESVTSGLGKSKRGGVAPMDVRSRMVSMYERIEDFTGSVKLRDTTRSRIDMSINKYYNPCSIERPRNEELI